RFRSFSGHGARRDLPPFPTRRSSDLPGGSAQDAQSASGFGTGQLTEQPAANGRSDQQSGQSPALLRRGDEARQRQLAELEACPEDRKSTRLNSSHVKISYAVLCLKKK